MSKRIGKAFVVLQSIAELPHGFIEPLEIGINFWGLFFQNLEKMVVFAARVIDFRCQGLYLGSIDYAQSGENRADRGEHILAGSMLDRQDFVKQGQGLSFRRIGMEIRSSNFVDQKSLGPKVPMNEAPFSTRWRRASCCRTNFDGSLYRCT